VRGQGDESGQQGSGENVGGRDQVASGDGEMGSSLISTSTLGCFSLELTLLLVTHGRNRLSSTPIASARASFRAFMALSQSMGRRRKNRYLTRIHSPAGCQLEGLALRVRRTASVWYAATTLSLAIPILEYGVPVAVRFRSITGR
jgi:hypothetical protein